MNVYQIEFEIKQADDVRSKRAEWLRDTRTLHVIFNGSIEKAIAKGKRALVGEREPWSDENGKKFVSVIRDVRVVALSRLCSIDVP